MKRLAIITILTMVTVAGYSQSAVTYSIIRSLDTLVLKAKSQPNRMVFPLTRGAGQGSVMRQGANGKMYFGTVDSITGNTEIPFDTICLDYCNGCTSDTGLIIVNGCFIFDTIGGPCGTPVISGDTIFYCGDTIVPVNSQLWVKSGNKIYPKSSNWSVGIGMANPQHKLHIEGNLFGNGAGHFEGGNGNVNGLGGLTAADALLMARYAAGIIPWFNGIIEGDISGNTNIGKLDADLVTSVSVGARTLAQARQLGRYLDGNQHTPLLDTTLLVFKGMTIQGYGKYLNISQAPNGNIFNAQNDVIGADSSVSITRNGSLVIGDDTAQAKLDIAGTVKFRQLSKAIGPDTLYVEDPITGQVMTWPLDSIAGGGVDTLLTRVYAGAGISITGSAPAYIITNTSPNVPEVFGDSTFKLGTIGGATKVHPWYGKKALNPSYPYFYTDGPMPSFTTQLNLDGTLNAYAFRSEITTAGKVNSMTLGGSSILTSAYDASTYVGTSGLINSTETYFYLTSYKSTSTASAPIIIGTIGTNDNYNGKYIKLDDSLQVFTVNYDTIKLAGKLPVMAGEADSVLLPDYANGGRLSMQKANTGGTGNSAVTPTSDGYMTTPYLNMMLGDSTKIKLMNFAGFVDNSQSTLSFNPTDSSLTLTKTGAILQYQRLGRICYVPNTQTVPITFVAGRRATFYFFINDQVGTMEVSTNPWTLKDSDDKIPVAAVDWDGYNGYRQYQLHDERHTSDWPRALHYSWHTTIGTRYQSGLLISGETVAPATASSANNQFKVAEGEIDDESLDVLIPVKGKPVTNTHAWTHFYRNSSNVWRWDTIAVPYPYSATYIQYDNNGTLTTAANNRYVNSYLLATNATDSARFIIIAGRGEYTSLALAQAEDPRSFSLQGLSTEGVILYRMTWNTGSTFTGALGRVKLAATPQFINGAIATTTVGVASTGWNLSGDTVVQSTSGPVQLHGPLKLQTVVHDSLSNIAILGGACAVNWATGNMQIVTLDANITSMTFTKPIGRATLHLVLSHNNSATDFTIAWPASVVWPGGTAPTSYGTTANGTFLISFSYYGGYYHASPASAQYAH